MPKRIQRKRTKGWRMPPNTISVCRPGKWGNPFGVAHSRICMTTDEAVGFHEIMAKYLFRKDKAWRERLVAELKCKNLACFCPLDDSCHADVLLELANQTEDE